MDLILAALRFSAITEPRSMRPACRQAFTFCSYCSTTLLRALAWWYLLRRF